MAWFLFWDGQESGIWIKWMIYLDLVGQGDQDEHVLEYF